MVYGPNFKVHLVLEVVWAPLWNPLLQATSQEKAPIVWIPLEKVNGAIGHARGSCRESLGEELTLLAPLALNFWPRSHFEGILLKEMIG